MISLDDRKLQITVERRVRYFLPNWLFVGHITPSTSNAGPIRMTLAPARRPHAARKQRGSSSSPTLRRHELIFRNGCLRQRYILTA